MASTIDPESGAELLAPSLVPDLWTVAVAAAGRGTRLGFDKPKILFPVAGVSILERLCGLFAPFCSRFVFVLSPDGAPQVEPILETLVPGRFAVALQPAPLGMGHAVGCAFPLILTEFTAIVWGDQVALKPSSIGFCMRLLSGGHFEAVCPTLLRPRPYIHFERDPVSGRVTSVLQLREGDVLPESGESDAGVFFFRTRELGRALLRLSDCDAAVGRGTKELNFLPIFPLIDSEPGKLALARIMTELESTGINSRVDAEYLAARIDA